MLTLAEKTGMHDRVMIISLFSESIAKVKELDPEITAASDGHFASRYDGHQGCCHDSYDFQS